MKLTGSAGVLPPGTTVRIRGAGLLGQRYVDVIPGTGSGNLPDGATVKGAPEALANNVPDALSTFDPRTRTATASLLDELGEGLDGRGAVVNRGLRAAPITAGSFTRFRNGFFARDGAAERLTPSLASGTAAFDAAKIPLTAAFSPTADGLDPFLRHRTAFQATLDVLPQTLATVRPALDRSRALLAAARNLSTAASTQLPPAPGALRETTALLNEARGPLQRTTALLDAADRAVPGVLDITDAAAPVLQPLRRTLTDLNPTLLTFGQHDCDIDNFAENWRSALGYGTPDGGQGAKLPSGDIGGLGLFRVTLLAGAESIQRVSVPTGTRPSDPYPGPCAESPGPHYSEPGSSR
jgi:ABC-type transporter Mla subunit MlaD